MILAFPAHFTFMRPKNMHLWFFCCSIHGYHGMFTNPALKSKKSVFQQSANLAKI